MNNNRGTLFVVSTPIGNLGDITYRAVEVLKSVDFIAAEDTRHSRIILKHYKFNNSLLSYHENNSSKQIPIILKKINSGLNIALISDAGTPGISDPGYLIIRECIQHEIRIECLPGPTACIPALVQSGLPCDRFTFEGFLPPKKGRKTRIIEISHEKKTSIIYESPHKILKTLKQFYEICPDRKIVVIKELTKLFETTYRGSIKDVIGQISLSNIKGEFVIILDGKKK